MKIARPFCLLLLTAYIAWIGWNAGHVYAAGPNHGCRQKGDTAHRCRHVSANGKEHVDKSHDGQSHIDGTANRWAAAWRQTKHAAFFGFQDDVSVPPECTCPISCFFSGDGLQSPNYPN